MSYLRPWGGSEIGRALLSEKPLQGGRIPGASNQQLPPIRKIPIYGVSH